jgi:glycosyltransferase involved in cell wall biosynthesis
MIQSSLIIATYNWPAALELCLMSVMEQSCMPTEIIIADDGSGNNTKLVVEKYQKLFTVPLIHLWHKDDGFKLAQIRNKAAAIAKDYIIQIDGDLILHKDFISNHLSAAVPGKFICGSRVILNNEITAKLINERPGKNRFGFFNKGISNRFNSLYLKNLSNLINNIKEQNNLESIRGCNMSYWRKDFIAVNGYNEDFTGWGREDSDLVIRFTKYGLKRRFFKFQGIVYHLYHKENDRSNLAQNDLILEKARKGSAFTCKTGVSQYL